jgi:AcrR family transcriptional regulator
MARSTDAGRGVREEDALAAAYACFARTGLQRTTMEDIARELRRSRPVAYRYFSDKNDAFRKVAQQLMDGALEAARTAAGEPDVAERVFGVLDAKLSLAIRVHAASPHHARTLLAEDSGVAADLAATYLRP